MFVELSNECKHGRGRWRGPLGFSVSHAGIGMGVEDGGKEYKHNHLSTGTGDPPALGSITSPYIFEG